VPGRHEPATTTTRPRHAQLPTAYNPGSCFHSPPSSLQRNVSLSYWVVFGASMPRQERTQLKSPPSPTPAGAIVSRCGTQRRSLLFQRIRAHISVDVHMDQGHATRNHHRTRGIGTRTIGLSGSAISQARVAPDPSQASVGFRCAHNPLFDVARGIPRAGVPPCGGRWTKLPEVDAGVGPSRPRSVLHVRQFAVRRSTLCTRAHGSMERP